ncbi:unnamed protein product [Parajaminaea phylloscopi]
MTGCGCNRSLCEDPLASSRRWSRSSTRARPRAMGRRRCGPFPPSGREERLSAAEEEQPHQARVIAPLVSLPSDRNHERPETTVKTERMARAKEPQVLLLGLRRSGKTSLLQVFHKHLPPNETLFLESTSRPYAVRLSPWGSTTVWDGLTAQALLSYAGKGGLVCTEINALAWTDVNAIIWVIDAQDDYLHSLASFHSTILLAYSHNPAIRFHVFLHKMDGLSEDYRDDTQTDVEKRIEDDLSDASGSFHFARGVDVKGIMARMEREAEDDNNGARIQWEQLESKATQEMGSGSVAQPITPQASNTTSSMSARQDNQPRKRRQSSIRSSSARGDASAATVSLETDVRLSLHQTSIFDSSMFVAFSRVLQELVLQSPGDVLKHALARLVDNLVDSCTPENISAASGKGALAVTADEVAGEAIKGGLLADASRRSPDPSLTLVFEKLYLIHLPTRSYLCSDSSPFDKSSFDVVCDYLGFLAEVGKLFANLRPSTEAGQSASAQDVLMPSSTVRLTSASSTGPSAAGAGGNTLDTSTSGLGTSVLGGSNANIGGGGGANPGQAAGAGAVSSSIEDETLLSLWRLDDNLALAAILRYDSIAVPARTEIGRTPALLDGGRRPSSGHDDVPHDVGQAVTRPSEGPAAVSDADSSKRETSKETAMATSPTVDASELAEAVVNAKVLVFSKALTALRDLSRGKREVHEVKKDLWSAAAQSASLTGSHAVAAAS